MNRKNSSNDKKKVQMSKNISNEQKIVQINKK